MEIATAASTFPRSASADVATLANDIADGPADRISDAEAVVLAERTGGNPFFVSEYARLPRAERAGGDIPSAIKSVLDRRLAGLDPAVLQVLRAAAVIGDVFDGPAIALLAATTRLDLDTLADYLDEAADERILISAHGRAGYEFAHGLLREHLLAGLPPLRRQRLHAKVAEQLDGGSLAGCRRPPRAASDRRATAGRSARWSSTRADWRPNRLPDNGVRRSPHAGGTPRSTPTTCCPSHSAPTATGTR